MVFMPAFQARLLTEIYVRLYSTYYSSKAKTSVDAKQI
jgi:hypothetical protein